MFSSPKKKEFGHVTFRSFETPTWLIKLDYEGGTHVPPATHIYPRNWTVKADPLAKFGPNAAPQGFRVDTVLDYI